jgi:Holliday junction resolvase
MTPDELARLAFRIFLHSANPEGLPIEALANRIRAVQKGLLPEDEFAATVCWLGHCLAIHRLDQTPMPGLDNLSRTLRAPDFLVVAEVGGTPVPVLIEVKSRHEQRLDWSEAYLRSLKRFAEIVHLPLLVAWKCGDLWTLVDVRHFGRNVSAMRLDLGRALAEDLFCALFRNLRLRMNPELELIFDLKVLDEVPDGPLFAEGGLNMEVVNAGFYYRGAVVRDYARELFSLFLSGQDEEEFRRTGKQACRLTFRPSRDSSFSLSNVLVREQVFRSGGDEVDWPTVLRRPFRTSGRALVEALPDMIRKHIVQYVFDIVPQTWPDFLPPRA